MDAPRWHIRHRKGRKSVAEVTCNCGAYCYPHRLGGGHCNGMLYLEEWWQNRACGDCRNITYDSSTFAPYCQVIEGGESLEECEMLQSFMQRNEVHIKGINWK